MSKIEIKEEATKKVDKLKILVGFLEYEEAYTFDIKSQERIRKMLKDLGYWKPTKIKK
jgi:nicotinamide mononucleotide adenylyltransferase